MKHTAHRGGDCLETKRPRCFLMRHKCEGGGGGGGGISTPGGARPSSAGCTAPTDRPWRRRAWRRWIAAWAANLSPGFAETDREEERNRVAWLWERRWMNELVSKWVGLWVNEAVDRDGRTESSWLLWWGGFGCGVLGLVSYWHGSIQMGPTQKSKPLDLLRRYIGTI